MMKIQLKAQNDEQHFCLILVNEGSRKMNGGEKSITQRSSFNNGGGEQTEIEESTRRSYLPPLPLLLLNV